MLCTATYAKARVVRVQKATTFREVAVPGWMGVRTTKASPERPRVVVLPHAKKTQPVHGWHSQVVGDPV